MEISDDNWKFRIVGPVDGTSERTEARYGSLVNGGKYILRVDEVNDGKAKWCSFTFLAYEERYKVTVGHIASRLIQHASPIVALVLMSIFTESPRL